MSDICSFLIDTSNGVAFIQDPEDQQSILRIGGTFSTRDENGNTRYHIGPLHSKICAHNSDESKYIIVATSTEELLEPMCNLLSHCYHYAQQIAITPDVVEKCFINEIRNYFYNSWVKMGPDLILVNTTKDRIHFILENLN